MKGEFTELHYSELDNNIRLLTLTAKAVARRGGRLVLVGPTPDVQRVLEVTGIPAVIPVYAHFESAAAVLLGS